MSPSTISRPRPAGEDPRIESLSRSFLAQRRLGIVSLNRTCNLRCGYCRPGPSDWYDRLAEDAVAKQLPRARWPELIEICRSNNIAEVLLTGGEPTFYADLAALVRTLGAAGIRSALHTHGGTPGALRFVRDCGDVDPRPNVHLSAEFFAEHQASVRGVEFPNAFLAAAADSGYFVELKVVLHDMLAPFSARLRDRLRDWRDRGLRSIRFQPVETGLVAVDPMMRVTPTLFPFLSALEAAKREDEFATFIRNSLQSIQNIKLVMNGDPAIATIAENCRVSERIVMINTDLRQLSCKTMWGKSETAHCSAHFDMICCGYQP